MAPKLHNVRLAIDYVAVGVLTKYANNARVHSGRQINKIAASLEEFGIVLPILIDASNVVVAGEAVLSAAVRLGYEQVPVTRVEHLSDTQVRALRLALDRLAEDATWDEVKLQQEVAAIAAAGGVDLALTAGFNDDEIEKLLQAAAGPVDGKTDPDAPQPTPASEAPAVTLPGDLWILGDHRIICGDSTSRDDVARVLAGSRPHLMVTDPPQKPVECMRRPIVNNSALGDAVYEPFSGSGTTIIAAEMTRRRCRALELNPAYVDVAVKRWQEFTGKVATLEGDGRSFAEIAAERGLTAVAA